MVMLTGALALESGHGSGSFINPMDLSPRFAGFLTGVTLCVTDFIGATGPLLVGYIVTDKVSCYLYLIKLNEKKKTSTLV